jgi:hypothetical protein
LLYSLNGELHLSVTMPRSGSGTGDDETAQKEQFEQITTQLAALVAAQTQLMAQQQSITDTFAGAQQSNDDRFLQLTTLLQGNTQMHGHAPAPAGDLLVDGDAGGGQLDEDGDGQQQQQLQQQQPQQRDTINLEPQPQRSAGSGGLNRAFGRASAPSEEEDPSRPPTHPADPMAPTPEEEAEELLQYLEKINVKGDATIAEQLAGGHPTPLPFDDAENPFERGRRFRAATGHLKPRLIGDSATAEIIDALQEIADDPSGVGKWALTYKHELYTLAPALSYQHDLAVALTAQAADAASALASGSLPPSLADMPHVLTAAATQAKSIYGHLNERFDVISALARRADVELETLAQVYEQGQQRAGTKSALGQAVSQQISDKKTASLTAIAGREEAKAKPFTAVLRPLPFRAPDFRSGRFRDRDRAQRRPAPAPAPAPTPRGPARAPAAPPRAPGAPAPAPARPAHQPPGQGAGRGAAGRGAAARGRGQG